MNVAPLVGAWIEMYLSWHLPLYTSVAPLVGAWIEITSPYGVNLLIGSLPSWERGLKLRSGTENTLNASRSPRGSVD